MIGNKVFEKLPRSFFNLLSSLSNTDLYSDLLLNLFDLYENNVDFRLPVETVKDNIAQYLAINNVSVDDDLGFPLKSYADAANRLIYKMSNPDVGWLRRVTDDVTLKDKIILTSEAVELAQYLKDVSKKEEANFSSYVHNIIAVLNNTEAWDKNPYQDGLKQIQMFAKSLARALQKCSNDIEDIAKKAIAEKTLSHVVKNISTFLADYMPQYCRLIRETNLYSKQGEIIKCIELLCEDEINYARLVNDCARSLDDTEDRYQKASQNVSEIINSFKTFIMYGYREIVTHINRQVVGYLDIMTSQLRFQRSHGKDEQRIVESVLMRLAEMDNEQAIEQEKDIESIEQISNLTQNTYSDLDSAFTPRIKRSIKAPVACEIEKIEDGMVDDFNKKMRESVNNPFSRSHVISSLKTIMEGKSSIKTSDLKLETFQDYVMEMIMAIYAPDDDCYVNVENEYMEKDDFIVRKTEIIKKQKQDL